MSNRTGSWEGFAALVCAFNFVACVHGRAGGPWHILTRWCWVLSALVVISLMVFTVGFTVSGLRRRGVWNRIASIAALALWSHAIAVIWRSLQRPLFP